jgi:hypothetical protein
VDERIQTLNPDPNKKGVNISRAKYEQMRAAVLAALEQEEPQTFYGLLDRVERLLGDSFEGSTGWYYTSVKLDLEARGEIERIPGTSPQQIRRRKRD